MGRPRKDISGKRFGRLTVINKALDREYKYGRSSAMWNAICDCGKHIVLPQGDFGKTRSCGCLLVDILRSSNFKRLVKQRLLIKYGVENVMLVPEIVARVKKTNLAKYGTVCTLHADGIKDKKIATWQRNLHVDNPFKSRLVKTKIRKTIQDKYGVTCNVSQSPEIRQKVVQTNIKRFGVSCNLHEPETEKRIKALWLLKYGVDHPCKLHLSSQQKEIQVFIGSLGLVFDSNITTLLPSGRELDIYVPAKKIAIEVNGVYWHSEQALIKNGVLNPKQYHLSKTTEAESLGIHLIHIYEDDWKYRQSAVKHRLQNILLSSKTVYGRHCTVKQIDSHTKTEFLVKYHTQGDDKSAIQFGLFYDNVLVGVMTFGKLRTALGSKQECGTYELMRFCTSVSVIGGASKLLAIFVTMYRPRSIVSYADRNWTTQSCPTVYDKLGFLKVSEGKPNYWYVVKDKRKHRFGFRKSVLSRRLTHFDISKSEYENMLMNGIDRIWDCGSLKYVKEIQYVN